MSDRADFELILVDGYTKEAKKIARENKRLERQLDRAAKAEARRVATKERMSNRILTIRRQQREKLARIEATERRARERAAKRSEAAESRRRAAQKRRRASIGRLGLGIGAAALTGGVVAGVGAGMAGKAIFNRVEETEATIFALDRLTRHGRRSFGELQDMSVRLGLDIDQTAHSFASFMKLQFPEAQAKKLIRLGADMQALGNSADDIQGIFRALGQIRSKGRVQAEEMLQLAERGVSQELINTALARNRGIGDPGGQQARVKIQGLQKAGKLSSAEFFVAFEQAINQKLGQSKAGESALKFVEKSLRGQKNRLSSQLKRFWIKTTDAATPGIMSGFERLSKGMSEFFADQENIARTERVMQSVGAAFTVVGETIGVLVPKAMEASNVFGTSFAEGFRAMGGEALTANGFMERTKELIDLMIPIASTLGRVIGAVAADLSNLSKNLKMLGSNPIRALFGDKTADMLAKAMGSNPASDSGFFPGTSSGNRANVDELAARRAQGVESGAAWGEGITAGINSQREKVGAAASALGGAADGSFRRSEEIHSPSRKARELGQFWGQGLGLGIEDETPDVALPGGSRASSLGSLGGARGTVTFGDITIHVDGGTDPQQTAQATFRAFEQHLDSALARIAGEAAA